MKTMMIFLLMVFSMSNVQAQKELNKELHTEDYLNTLDEVNVNYENSIKGVTNVEGYDLIVKENYRNQFQENPVKFCDENVDIQSLIDFAASEEYDDYEIVLTTRKGSIKAVYDDEGNLERTQQKFKNVLLPRNIRHDLVRDHNGWSMTANKYVASGKENKVHKEKYLIYLQNGDASKKLKIKPTIASEGRGY